MAAAGRSAKRLAQAVREADTGSGPVAVLPGVDVTRPQTLLAMAERARLVISAVGPYRLYGEAVVTACVSAGADYFDVCGEPG